MKDKQFDINLSKVIGLLPDYEPNPLVWNKIEAQLEFDEKLDSEIAKLPMFEFKPDVWNKIEKHLDKPIQKIGISKFKKLTIYMLSAAALIVILIGIASVFRTNNETKITYSQEYVATSESVDEPEKANPDPIKFLEENCANVPEVCSSPEFLEQKKQLIELNTEYKNIKEVIKMYGESPELVKSLIKIENLKSEILKDLIKTLNS